MHSSSTCRDLFAASSCMVMLERSGQRMRDFLATLAHELRNPLAPIRNAISSMQI